MINISIVDDDEEIIEQLDRYLRRFSEENGAEFNIRNYRDALSFLDEAQYPDIVLMDIEMPHLDGMKAAQNMRRVAPKVALIFITNSVQYAVKGYSVDAIDYVLKPVTYTRFSSLMKKTLRIVGQNAGAEIYVKTLSGVRKLYSNSILYVEIRGHLLNYYLADERIETWGTLKEVEQKLPSDSFVRCNHCCIVNLKHVTSVQKDVIKLSGTGTELTVSHGKKKEFTARFNRFMGG